MARKRPLEPAVRMALTEIRTCYSRIDTAIDKIDRWASAEGSAADKIARIRAVLWEAERILGPEIVED